MSFSIEQITANDIQLVQLTDNSNGTVVQVAPQYGAMLHAFTVITPGGPHNIIDNYSDKKEIEELLSMSYKSSKLSPFVCRIKEGKYFYEGEEFEFEKKFVDGSAIHGLLFDKPFLQTDEFADDEQAYITFKYNYKQEAEGYPFSYRCEIRYTLMPGNVLQLQTTIINLDDLSIPIADGWHPYFTLGGNIDAYTLYFNAAAKLEFDQNLIPTGKLLSFGDFNTAKQLGSLQLDNCFLLNADDSLPVCILTNETTGIGLEIYAAATYPYLQLYTPPHRKSIAIENLSAAPDAFNNRMGLLLLEPRRTTTFACYYRITQE